MNERLIMVIDFLKENRIIFNDSDFAEQVGKDRSYISNVKSGRRPVTRSFCNDIVETFSMISKHWLLTGEGEMLKTANPSNTNQKEEETSSEAIKIEVLIQDVLKLFKKKDEQLDRLLSLLESISKK